MAIFQYKNINTYHAIAITIHQKVPKLKQLDAVFGLMGFPCAQPLNAGILSGIILHPSCKQTWKGDSCHFEQESYGKCETFSHSSPFTIFLKRVTVRVIESKKSADTQGLKFKRTRNEAETELKLRSFGMFWCQVQLLVSFSPACCHWSNSEFNVPWKGVRTFWENAWEHQKSHSSSSFKAVLGYLCSAYLGPTGSGFCRKPFRYRSKASIKGDRLTSQSQKKCHLQGQEPPNATSENHLTTQF